MTSSNAEQLRPYRRAPIYRINLGGVDITPRVNGRLISLSIRESRGDEADQLDLEISDHDGRLELPRRGAEISVAIGWRDGALYDKGQFTVDEVEHQGAPDTITIRARAANMRGTLPGHRTQSWHNITLGAIVRTIAGRHQLGNRIADGLDGIRVGHIDQVDESDLNFLTRLGSRYDAIAAVKEGLLVLTRAGTARTVGGLELPTVTISREAGDRHRYAAADREAYTGVKAYWNNTTGARREIAIIGGGDNAKQLRPTYASRADALQAAQAEFDRIQRGAAELTLTLVVGRPDIAVETPVRVAGYKPEIDATAWIVTEVAHSLSDSGLITDIKCETDGSAAPNEEDGSDGAGD